MGASLGRGRISRQARGPISPLAARRPAPRQRSLIAPLSFTAETAMPQSGQRPGWGIVFSGAFEIAAVPRYKPGAHSIGESGRAASDISVLRLLPHPPDGNPHG